MKPDPLVDEVRAARKKISARFGHDPKRIGEYYRALQEQYRDRFVKQPRKTKPTVDESAA